MLESKDPAIKLFGMKIPLSSTVFEAEEYELSAEQNQNETLTDQSDKEKNLKKPTKILPCPRCNSMETKFCYYNNYNVNQPRHFCKACQRYWTSGGTMRSVPVGAGRRKNKNNSSSHYRHVTINETNGPVLSFNLRDDHKTLEKNNHQPVDNSRTRNNEMNGLRCIPGVSWPYTWNHGFYPVYPYWNVPMVSSSPYSTPNSTLGKHSREEDETIKRKQMNGSVLVPKTLRIDDPNEAAKSSIWTTLGIKNEVMFKGFDSKKEEFEQLPEGGIAQKWATGEGFPLWSAGMAAMYATELVANHFIEGFDSTLLMDMHADSKLLVNQVLHIHCRHGDGDFSKFDFFQHHYDHVNLAALDVSVVKDYATQLAVETWRMINPVDGKTVSQPRVRRDEL